MKAYYSNDTDYEAWTIDIEGENVDNFIDFAINNSSLELNSPRCGDSENEALTIPKDQCLKSEFMKEIKRLIKLYKNN